MLRSMWDLPRPGMEPVSPALAGGFLTTVPPGKSGGVGMIPGWGVKIPHAAARQKKKKKEKLRIR